MKSLFATESFADSSKIIRPDALFSLYVNVALPMPQDEPYQYAVPKNQEKYIEVGRRVKVPLGTQRRIGYIVGTSLHPQVKKIKPIVDVLDKEENFLSDEFYELTRWMSEYYYCAWGQAIDALMPTPFKRGKTYMKSRPRKQNIQENEIYVHATPEHTLTHEQNAVYQNISSYIDTNQSSEFLLHGVTGSGKTEIYLKLIKKLISENRGAIVLVPEISLTPQTTERFRSRFGNQVAVVHSRVSEGKKLEEWHRLRTGEAKVVVGARSAVFSPVKNLGIIIIDEEHDDSYKQEETPRYETHRVAAKRAQLNNAILLRASATPSLESFTDAGNEIIQLLELPNRILKQPLPQVEVIDIRTQKAGKSLRLFSIPLENAIKQALDHGEQVMLLMNRRGFSACVYCPSCGNVISCPQCRVSLTFHYDKQNLLCHTCYYSQLYPQICNACQAGKLHLMGFGTEKVEIEAAKLFPKARITRMDRDATTKKNSHEKILGSFRKKEIDILIGTQMIAKGHDFPGVSVIGVMLAETSLTIPDFRSVERTFALLTQVAGRAGRKDIEGKVFIQTYMPQHYAIQSAKTHDYKSFFNTEIKYRKQLNLPPYSNLIQVVISGKMEKNVLKKSLELKKLIEVSQSKTNIQIMGPAPCLISKRQDQYYWNLYLKVNDILQTNEFLRRLLQSFDKKGIRLTFDINPR